MIRPTVDQVREYCESRCNGIDAEKFVDHYQMVGWLCGKTRKPMKDWQAAIRLWERNQKPKQHVLDKHTSRDWAN